MIYDRFQVFIEDKNQRKVLQKIKIDKNKYQ